MMQYLEDLITRKVYKCEAISPSGGYGEVTVDSTIITVDSTLITMDSE